jgi:hypothetical protein
VTITHAGARENIQEILFLGKVETSWCASDRDTKKMMERTEVFHSKFMAKGSSDGGKKGLRGGGENNVIDIEKEIG